ncbi:hypothetical protein GTY54_41640 [Streptomyces sp. SID625]|nr:hypothetical protein [Streptomyces sp. SID625]
MTRSSRRTTWTTETIRAVDLTDEDMVLVGGVWREIFDVWKDDDDPTVMFGEGEPTTTALLDKIDWDSPCWVGIRYVDEDRSTSRDIVDALHFFRLRELVQVQKEVPYVPPTPLQPPRGRKGKKRGHR